MISLCYSRLLAMTDGRSCHVRPVSLPSWSINVAAGRSARGGGGGGGGYSHTLPIRVCAAQRGRDFEAPDLERGTISEAFSRTGYNIPNARKLQF